MSRTWKSLTLVGLLGMAGLAISVISDRAEAQQIPSLSGPLFPFNYPKNSNMGLATAPVRSGTRILAQAANYTVLSQDVESEITNSGASGVVQYILPTCNANSLGWRGTFSVVANQNIVVATNGTDTFATPALTGTTHTILTSSNVKGGSMTATCNATGSWRSNASTTNWASN